MILDWKIRCLHTQKKEFFDRSLFLDMRALPPERRIALEAFIESRPDNTNDRGWLRFKSWFDELSSNEERLRRIEGARHFSGFSLVEYFEDELGQEISMNKIAQVLLGDENAFATHGAVAPHEWDWIMANRQGVPVVNIANVKFEEYGRNQLRQFCKNGEELRRSPIVQGDVCTLTTTGGFHGATLKTPLNKEEITSSALLYRRIMAETESVNFPKIVALLEKRADGILARYVRGEFARVEQFLASRDLRTLGVPMMDNYPQPPGSIKQLFDAYFYTQIIHVGQPKHQKRYAKWLAWAPCEDFLHYLFLSLLSQICANILKVYLVAIEPLWHLYLTHHGDSDAPTPLGISEHASLGSQEKREDRERRIFEEKSRKLANELWIEAERPPEGPTKFQAEAERQLRALLK